MNLSIELKKMWLNTTTRNTTIILTIYILLFLLFKNRYDYKEYERQWQFLLDGGNPWDHSSNAYGPLHNLLGYFYEIHKKIPRLIFALVATITTLHLSKTIQRNGYIDDKLKKTIHYLLLLNPLLWYFIVVNGCNDGLVASLFVLGISLYGRNKFITSALLLSLAILYKYIPLFILPVLCLNNRKINWKFTASVTGFLALGFGVTYMIWSNKFLTPLLYNTGRESKILSIFRYLRGDYSFLKMVDIESIDYLSTWLVIASVIMIFTTQLIYQWNYVKGVLVTMMFVFIFYKIGHYQFYLSLYFLIFYYISQMTKETYYQINVLLNFIYWIIIATMFYILTDGFYKSTAIIREFIGLPHFLIFIITIYLITKKRGLKTI